MGRDTSSGPLVVASTTAANTSPLSSSSIVSPSSEKKECTGAKTGTQKTADGKQACKVEKHNNAPVRDGPPEVRGAEVGVPEEARHFPTT